MLRKAVIPSAGFGTRMLPATKSIPKEMLPILDRPAIQLVVEEAADAGVTDAMLIVSRDKKAVEDHFDRHPELEARLEQTGKRQLITSIDTLLSRIHVYSKRQPEQRGLGDAVLHAERFVGNEHFLCLLGDTVFPAGREPSREIVDLHKRLGGMVVALEEVDADKVSRYGIAAGNTVEPGVIRIEELVEKPSMHDAPSRLAIAGRYVLSHTIFKHLRNTKPGKGGEIQLTDAIRAAIAAGEPVFGYTVKASRYDIGNPLDWLLTNIDFALADPTMEPLIRARMNRR